MFGRRPSRWALAHILVECVFAILFPCCLLLLCWFSFFSTTPMDWLERTSPKYPTLSGLARKTLTQSVLVPRGNANELVCDWR